jgi:hypothetical protein
MPPKPQTGKKALSVGKELAAERGKAGKEFSRGIVFSRSRSKAAMEDRELLDKAVNLPEAQFKKFADRLSKMKDIKNK